MNPKDLKTQTDATEKWNEFAKKLHQYLCPPGNGVYTVHTFREQKNKLHQSLYGTHQPDVVRERWQASLQGLPEIRSPIIFGICSDNGGGILRGANWGPLFIRETLYRQSQEQDHASPHHLFDLGDVRVIPHLLLDEYLHPKLLQNCRTALYQNPQSSLPVSPLSIALDMAQNFYKLFPEKRIFGLGGDHSISYPLVHAYLQAKKAANKNVALIHFDAHTDLLSERLGVGICFGSWTYHVLNDLPSPSHLVQIGIRSSGKSKEHWENTFGIKQCWANEIREKGASAMAEEILEYLRTKKVEEIYITFDIDAIDSQYAFATGTPEADGLFPHEAVLMIQDLCEEFPLGGADLVEVAPFTLSGKPPGLSPEPETTLMTAQAISQALIESLSKELSKESPKGPKVWP